MWTNSESFISRVQEVWQEYIQGVSMFKTATKLKRLKKSLKELNRDKFADIDTKADEAYKNLMQVQ